MFSVKGIDLQLVGEGGEGGEGGGQVQLSYMSDCPYITGNHGYQPCVGEAMECGPCHTCHNMSQHAPSRHVCCVSMFPVDAATSDTPSGTLSSPRYLPALLFGTITPSNTGNPC